eukprot:1143420-Pelagomonas_calceolata.AAC.3
MHGQGQGTVQLTGHRSKGAFGQNKCLLASWACHPWVGKVGKASKHRNKHTRQCLTVREIKILILNVIWDPRAVLKEAHILPVLPLFAPQSLHAPGLSRQNAAIRLRRLRLPSKSIPFQLLSPKPHQEAYAGCGMDIGRWAAVTSLASSWGVCNKQRSEFSESKHPKS